MNRNRSNVPLWPPNKYGAYQNLSSAEDLPLQDTPSMSTPGTGISAAYQNLLTPNVGPSPYNTPGSQRTPLGRPESILRYDCEAPKKRWFGYGWRGGARLAFFGILLVLIVNIVLLLYMTLAFPKMDGFPVIYRGTCENAETQNAIWHFVLNVLSTCLLSGSNYCMQLLSAPTRSNIDSAHRIGRWLDIGIPSIRNLRFIPWKRRALWIMLAVSSIPLHLVYNSTFYAALSTRNYNILYATQDFVNGGGYDKRVFIDTPERNITRMQTDVSSWVRLSNQDCIQNYAHDFLSDYQNVIAIVSDTTVSRNNSLLKAAVNDLPAKGEITPSYDSFAWICDDPLTSNKTGVTNRNSANFVPCSAQVTALAKIANDWWRSGGYEIKQCYAEPIQADCHLHFSPHLMGPIVFMNLVKCFVAFYIAFRMLDVPLVTLGDAIESFIKFPDSTTAGNCLMTAKEADRHFIKSSSQISATSPKQYNPRRQRWWDVVTPRQWATLGFLLAIMLGGLSVGITFGIRALAPPTFSNAWSLGLGRIQTQNLVLGANLPQLGASAVLITALIANAPQALLSFLYMIYNTIFTTMWLGEDWDIFGVSYDAGRRHSLYAKSETHRMLRVSDPKGQQKSTHMLNLPWRYALPMITISGVLHWLMSQTLFLANIGVIPRDGSIPNHDEITTIAFSPQGMIWLILVALFMLLAVVVTGLRRFKGGMPIVGSNSAAISAACHVENLSDVRRREMVLHKIAWGEIPSSTDADDTKRPVMHTRDLSSGLGISNDGRKSRFATEDFTELRDDNDLEDNGYHSLRGQAELTDSSGTMKVSRVAHCSFSDGFVKRPEPGRVYA